MPSRNYFSHEAIPALYNKCHETVENELGDVLNFAATSDLWSSTAMEPYISVTVHFITADFEIEWVY